MRTGPSALVTAPTRGTSRRGWRARSALAGGAGRRGRRCRRRGRGTAGGRCGALRFRGRWFVSRTTPPTLGRTGGAVARGAGAGGAGGTVAFGATGAGLPGLRRPARPAEAPPGALRASVLAEAFPPSGPVARPPVRVGPPARAVRAAARATSTGWGQGVPTGGLLDGAGTSATAAGASTTTGAGASTTGAVSSTVWGRRRRRCRFRLLLRRCRWSRGGQYPDLPTRLPPEGWGRGLHVALHLDVHGLAGLARRERHGRAQGVVVARCDRRTVRRADVDCDRRGRRVVERHDEGKVDQAGVALGDAGVGDPKGRVVVADLRRHRVGLHVDELVFDAAPDDSPTDFALLRLTL